MDDAGNVMKIRMGMVFKCTILVTVIMITLFAVLLFVIGYC